MAFMWPRVKACPTRRSPAISGVCSGATPPRYSTARSARITRYPSLHPSSTNASTKRGRGALTLRKWTWKRLPAAPRPAGRSHPAGGRCRISFTSRAVAAAASFTPTRLLHSSLRRSDVAVQTSP